VIAKYTRLTEGRLLEETYNFYREQWLKDGVPSPEGIQKNIEVAAADIPEAKNARPEQFIDLGILNKIKGRRSWERRGRRAPFPRPRSSRSEC
jgi:hypothetical protein